jgi:hypothetical protein
MSITKAIFAIDSIESLREAQNALNVRYRELQSRAARTFIKGDKVSFRSNRTGEFVTGIVEKINQKTVSVRTPTANWKVSPSLLKRS